MNEQEEHTQREHDDKQEENMKLYYLTQVPFVSSYGGLVGDCMWTGHGDVGESIGKYKGAKVELKCSIQPTTFTTVSSTISYFNEIRYNPIYFDYLNGDLYCFSGTNISISSSSQHSTQTLTKDNGKSFNMTVHTEFGDFVELGELFAINQLLTQIENYAVYSLIDDVNVGPSRSIYLFGGVSSMILHRISPFFNWQEKTLILFTNSSETLPSKYFAHFITPTHIYLIGGVTNDNDISKSMFRSRFSDLQNWEYLGDFPVLISKASAFVIGKNVYVLGGVVNDLSDPNSNIYSAKLDDLESGTGTGFSVNGTLPDSRHAVGCDVILTLDYGYIIGDEAVEYTDYVLIFPINDVKSISEISSTSLQSGLPYVVSGNILHLFSSDMKNVIKATLPNPVPYCFGLNAMDSMSCSGNGNCVANEYCECYSGYNGMDCSIVFSCGGVLSNDSRVCNGSGVCYSDEKCYCSKKNGTYCEYEICNGVSSAQPSLICGGHGTCSNGHCACDMGYTDDNCQTYTCFGQLMNESMVCSGHGNCSSLDDCTCYNGYFGSTCQQFNCGAHSNDQISLVCSGNGTCVGPNNCICKVGHYGANCEAHTCYDQMFNSSTACNGHGLCTSPNQCTCFYGYTGSNCSIPVCFGDSASVACSSHGQCTGPDQCNCTDGYYGSKCSTFACYGYEAGAQGVCSSHGVCIAPNNCTCTDTYEGNTCSHYKCFGLRDDNPAVCGGNGKCNKTNLCNCNEGYYSADCSIFYCNNTHFDNYGVCSSHGVCSSPNNCTCQSGYYGSDCQYFDCFNIRHDDPSVCSGNGSCVQPNKCQCSGSYSGESCGNFTCFGVEKNASNACSGHGKCIDWNLCECSSGYHGSKCGIFSCGGIDSKSLTACSGNGSCTAPDTCDCLDGYYGDNCQSYNCFNILHNNSTTCSSHGKCISKDTCKCDEGYKAADCSVFSCFNYEYSAVDVCNGRGECIAPNTCSCTIEGFFGLDCNMSTSFEIVLNISNTQVLYSDDYPIFGFKVMSSYNDSDILGYRLTSFGLAPVNQTSNEFTINTSQLPIGMTNYNIIAKMKNTRTSTSLKLTVIKLQKSRPIDSISKFSSVNIPSYIVSRNFTIFEFYILNLTITGQSVSSLFGCSSKCLVDFSFNIYLTGDSIDSVYNITSGKGSSYIFIASDGTSSIRFSPILKIPTFALTKSELELGYYLQFDFTIGSTSGSKRIPILAPPKPSSGLLTAISSINRGIALTDVYKVSTVQLSAASQLLPLSYALAFYEPVQGRVIRMSPFLSDPSANIYLPYLSTSGNVSSVEIYLLVKDGLENIDQYQVLTLEVTPYVGNLEKLFNQTLPEPIKVVLPFDNSVKTSTSSSVMEQVVKNMEIVPSSPESSLSVLQKILPANPNAPAVFGQVQFKIQSFLGTIQSNYVSEQKSYGFVKNRMSSESLQTTLNIISDLFTSTRKYPSNGNTSTNEDLVLMFSKILLSDSLPKVIDSKETILPTVNYYSNEMNLTVSSLIFGSNESSTEQHVISGTKSKLSLDLKKVAKQFNGYSSNVGITLITYSQNAKSDNYSTSTQSGSSVVEFKYYQDSELIILKNLDSPFTLEFTPLNEQIKQNLTLNTTVVKCMYWNEDFSMWKSDGCQYSNSSSDSIICQCTHTTKFSTFIEYTSSYANTTMTETELLFIASVYSAEISFGIIFAICSAIILIVLIRYRNEQPLLSRFVTPFLGMIALLVESVLISIVQRSVLVSQLLPSQTKMWESGGETATNIVGNVTMIIVNTLNLTAILAYVIQVIRFQLLKYLYDTIAQKNNGKSFMMKSLRFITSKKLFISTIIISLVFNLCYWLMWVLLVRLSVISASQYTDAVSISYTTIIFGYSLIITLVTIVDILGSSKQKKTKKRRRSTVASMSSSGSSSTLSLTKQSVPAQATGRFFYLDAPLFFRSEMVMYLICFAFMIVQQAIGLVSNKFRFINSTNYEIALYFDGIRFAFEVLYTCVYLFVFGGFAILVLISYKMKTKKRSEKINPDQQDTEMIDTIADDRGFELFENFCIQELATENLYLLELLRYNPEFVEGRSMSELPNFLDTVHDLFIKNGAVSEVNISSGTKKRFVQMMKMVQEEKTISTEKITLEVQQCFEELQDQVSLNLGDTFSRFVLTSTYENYKEQRAVKLELVKQANIDIELEHE